MAMMASKGCVEVAGVAVDDVSAVRSDAEPRRSAAAPTMPVDDDWTCDAEYSLSYHHLY